jgi:hypothetical protein
MKPLAFAILAILAGLIIAWVVAYAAVAITLYDVFSRIH